MAARRLLAGSALASAAMLAVGVLAGAGDVSGGAGEAAAAIAAGPANTARPTIVGTARDGQTLTASNGTWSGSGTLGYAYQWQLCDGNGANCANVAGATNNTYVLAAGDVGKTVGIAVTATDSTGSSTAYSDLAGPVAPKGSVPAYATQPSISGTARQGATLTVADGAWEGTTPITFAYVWLRCDTSGKNCGPIAGATGRSYVLAADDAGHTLLVAVKATNSFGSQVGFTNPTGVVASAGAAPASTTQPAISGTAHVGQKLTLSAGVWSGTAPITYTYQWERCDAAGANCALIAGATATTYTLVAADAGHTLLAAVKATNSLGTQTGFSNRTAVVTTLVAPGAAVPASSVALPNRLVISGVAFSPNRLTPTTSRFQARFRVSDSNGHPVSGALVYAIGLPYGRVTQGTEVPTDGAGYATISFSPTIRFSTRRGFVVFFVRARKSGDNLLAGVSTRRLVQVTTGS